MIDGQLFDAVDGPARPIIDLRPIAQPAWRAQLAECGGGLRRRPGAWPGAHGDRRRVAALRGPRPPPRARGHARRRAVRQRQQGDQPGRGGPRARQFRSHLLDRRRAAQGGRSGRAAAVVGSGAPRLSDRRGGRELRPRAGRARPVHAKRRSGQRRAPGSRCRMGGPGPATRSSSSRQRARRSTSSATSKSAARRSSDWSENSSAAQRPRVPPHDPRQPHRARAAGQVVVDHRSRSARGPRAARAERSGFRPRVQSAGGHPPGPAAPALRRSSRAVSDPGGPVAVRRLVAVAQGGLPAGDRTCWRYRSPCSSSPC